MNKNLLQALSGLCDVIGGVLWLWVFVPMLLGDDTANAEGFLAAGAGFFVVGFLLGRMGRQKD